MLEGISLLSVTWEVALSIMWYYTFVLSERYREHKLPRDVLLFCCDLNSCARRDSNPQPSFWAGC